MRGQNAHLLTKFSAPMEGGEGVPLPGGKAHVSRLAGVGEVGYLSLKVGEQLVLDETYSLGGYGFVREPPSLIWVGIHGNHCTMLLRWLVAPVDKGLQLLYQTNRHEVWMRLRGCSSEFVLLEEGVRTSEGRLLPSNFLLYSLRGDPFPKVDPQQLHMPLHLVQRPYRGYPVRRGRVQVPYPLHGVGEYLSPDGQYIARLAYGEGEVRHISVWRLKAGYWSRVAPSLKDVTNWIWSPFSPSRLLVATSALYGSRAGIFCWEGGAAWRSLVDTDLPRDVRVLLSSLSSKGTIKYVLKSLSPIDILEYEVVDLRRGQVIYSGRSRI